MNKHGKKETTDMCTVSQLNIYAVRDRTLALQREGKSGTLSPLNISCELCPAAP